MKYLIDTNAWIGFFDGDAGFGSRARTIMQAESEECCVSVASLWEAAIKVGLGKLKLPYDVRLDLPRLLEENGFEVLPVEVDDALGVRDLPEMHRDPFDRIQVLQAQRRGLTMISRDPIFAKYGVRSVW